MILKDYQEIDGITVFHPDARSDHSDYNARGFESLHTQEEKHFWFIARKEFIYRYMSLFIRKQSKIRGWHR